MDGQLMSFAWIHFVQIAAGFEGICDAPQLIYDHNFEHA